MNRMQIHLLAKKLKENPEWVAVSAEYYVLGAKEVLLNPEKYGLIPINNASFSKPFRVGRKQGRAVLDANGLEVVIFPKGREQQAVEYVDFLNSKSL